MEELKKAKKRNKVKLAILEANIMKGPMKCKPTYLEKFKEWHVQIPVQWNVMDNYLHVGNPSPEFWVDIAQTYLEIVVAQNMLNSIKFLEKEEKYIEE